jgi:hypothetical protein
MSAAARRYGWVLNLDAELELAQASYNPSARVLSQLEEYGTASRALLGAEDVLVRKGMSNAEALIGRAWCPTPRAIAALLAAGVRPEPFPSVEVLRRVNHRRFAFELGGGLPTQQYVEDRAALEAILSRGGDWLLKRPLAFAGRGQLRVFRALSADEWAWIDASLATDGLIVEPLVRPLLELSQHGFIWPSGEHEIGRQCVQEVSERGAFRAVRRAAPEELTRSEGDALRDTTERVALALIRAGYFGPFGIDAHRYELAGKSGFCALGEINARYTMGFVTGFPRPACELSLDER